VTRIDRAKADHPSANSEVKHNRANKTHSRWKPSTEKLIANYRNAFIERRDWAEARGSKFLFVIPPDKDRVYSEYLPKWLPTSKQSERVTRILQALNAAGVDMVYLGNAELAAKPAGQLYYKNDTHWNALGGIYGAEAVVARLRQMDPRIPTLDTSRFDVVWRDSDNRSDGHAFDAGVKIGVPFLRDEVPAVVPIDGWHTTEHLAYPASYKDMPPHTVHIFEQNAPQLPTLVMYGDSFSPAMYRVLAEHFRRAVFVIPWERRANCESAFPVNILEDERPDFFIFERVETGLSAPTANPAGVRKTQEFDLPQCF
jgi:alginate O-acetyltransferase complex protein AlgJ